MYVIQSRDGNMINNDANVKNWLIGLLVNPSTCNCKCYKEQRIDEYLYIKNCENKKHPFDELVLVCEDTKCNRDYISN